MEFRVIWEIEVEADSPRQAADEARAIQLRADAPATIFDVWEYGRQRLHRIDIIEEMGRLESGELTFLRAHLRLLQCSPALVANTRDLVSVMLVFLDEEEGFLRRCGPE